MKSWRGVLAVAVLLGGLAGYALAEGDKGDPGGQGGPGGPGGKPDKPPRPKRPEPGRIIKIALDHAADLNLTEEQKAKLEELLKNAPKKDGPPGDGPRPPKDGGGDKNGLGPKDGPQDGKHPPEGKDGQGPPEGKKPGGVGDGDKPRVGGEGEKRPPKDSPLSKILSEEQMAKLKDILKAEGIGGPGGDKGGPGGDKGGDRPKGPPPGGDQPKGPPPGGDGGGK